MKDISRSHCPVILLAGGQADPHLQIASGALNTWEIKVPGVGTDERLLHRAVRAYVESGHERVFVYGNAKRLTTCLAEQELQHSVTILPETAGPNARLSDSVFAATTSALAHLPPETDYVILSATDMPLLNAEAIRVMLDTIVRKIGPTDFPHVIWPICYTDAYRHAPKPFDAFDCTSLPLKSEPVTGGNIFVVDRHKLPELHDLIAQATAGRKAPLALARMLGPMSLLRLALSLKMEGLRFTIDELEQLVAERLNVVMRAVPTHLVEISADIDNQTRYETMCPRHT